MQPQVNSLNKIAAALGRLLVIVVIATIFYCIYIVAYAILTYESTGLLSVSSSDSNAGLTLSQANHQAVAIGTGNARVRLKPGTYQVSATDNNYQTSADVQVYKKRLTTSNVVLVSSELSANSSDLFNELPIVGPASLYQIALSRQAVSNGPPDVVVITANSPQARQYALQWIRYQGFDPSDYKIEFINAQVYNLHSNAN